MQMAVGTNLSLWAIVVGAIAATYLWRMLGVILSRRISPGGAVFQWVTCVSYAMLAGLIARMTVLPAGALVEVELWIRITGIVVGVGAFFLAGRMVLLSVAAGLVTFISLVTLSG